MKNKIKCPHCGAENKIYGLPYGLQIMTSEHGEGTDVHPVILIHCENCGSVLGGYKDESLEEPEARSQGE